MAKTGPLICEVTRGTMVESVHRVHAIAMDGSGIVQQWGDADLMMYPRSAIKYMQAIPLVELGAADAWQLSEQETALACASHSGERTHVSAVNDWLSRMDLGEGDLACGAHLPYDEPYAHEMIAAGEKPTRLNNNCSGKHAGFLTTAKHLGEPTEGYLDADHPVQKRLHDILVDFGGEDLIGTGRGIDGCGIPVYGMTLGALARAAQRMAAPTGVSDVRGQAIQRILKAGMKYPYMVAGRARFDTDTMSALNGMVATKAGAEGLHVAIAPSKGLGIVLKAEDGAKRAADVAMGWLLGRYGFLNDAAKQDLASHLTPTITNAAGDKAGIISIAD
jgi:L-asparaginase II